MLQQLTVDNGREHPVREEMQVVFLLPPFTRGAGGVKTLAKTSIFAFIGMLPNRQLTFDIRY
ncbi:MAG TPA: hypothetical protein DEA78_27190 [Cyanobacteria bacterium UBA11159]|nr:hypothetical protein [Cyanobacteria bacterium UBA11366]HBR77258.1 hypothetical protein [Cyanobacteria bacterium UBA11159]